MVKEMQEMQAIYVIGAIMVLVRFLPSQKQAIINSTVSFFTVVFSQF
jgi:hypothetical protein